MLFDWLVVCLTSHRQRGHFKDGTPFIVPCKGREARFLHSTHRESNPNPSRGSNNRCATPAPLILLDAMIMQAMLPFNV